MTDSSTEQQINRSSRELQPAVSEKKIAPHTEQRESIEKNEPNKEKKPVEKRPSPRPFALPILKRRPKPVIPQVRDDLAVKIEKILEDGVGDAYSRLSPVAKQEFKLKGEETALEIRVLLKSTHVKVKKVLQLILEWLKLLPGINRFFLEQEAKIKTDRIIALHKHSTEHKP